MSDDHSNCAHSESQKIPRQEVKGFTNKLRRAWSDTVSRLWHGVDPVHGELHTPKAVSTAIDTINITPISSAAPISPRPLVLNPNPPPVKPHWHPNKIGPVGRTAIVACSLVMLGAVIHGGVNMVRGVRGDKDEALGIDEPASVKTFLVGASESLGGAALLKRLLTGQFRF